MKILMIQIFNGINPIKIRKMDPEEVREIIRMLVIKKILRSANTYQRLNRYRISAQRFVEWSMTGTFV